MADVMNLSLITSLDQFKISAHPGPAVDARKAIKTLLENYTVAINGTVINAAQAKKYLGDKAITPVKVPFIVQGTCLVYGNGDSGNGSHPITAHHTVCFCMETANSVTGVNPQWTIDEYKPVGIALAPVSNGRRLIPVILGAFAAEASEGGEGGGSDTPFELTSSLSAGGEADAEILEHDGEEFVGTGEFVEVVDHLYQALSGQPGDRGYYQVHGLVNNIKTLTCTTS